MSNYEIEVNDEGFITTHLFDTMVESENFCDKVAEYNPLAVVSRLYDSDYTQADIDNDMSYEREDTIQPLNFN